MSIIKPISINTTLPAGTDDNSSPYTDDIYLESLVFPEVTFSTNESFVAASQFEVITGRENLNAEWGDNDSGADGDPNPFVKAGLDPALQETTDPAIQDPALLDTFNSLSLTEINDGEQGDFSFRVEFAKAIADNDFDDDETPEIVLFERGGNDEYTIRLIIGGTFEEPVFSEPLETGSTDYWDTGIEINTVEIDDSQEVSVGGYDLNAWDLAPGTVVRGMEITAENQGPDFAGFFLSAEDPAQFIEKMSFEKKVVDVDDRGPDAKVNAAGQVISYELIAKNTGDAKLTNVTITDPLSSVTKDVGDLEPGDEVVVAATYTVTQEDIDANGIDAGGNPDGDGDIDNIATASSNQTGEDTDAAEVLIAREPSLAIVKTADTSTIAPGGGDVTYTYTVSNTGNVTLTNLKVTDDDFTPGDTSDDFEPNFTGGDTDDDGELDVGETWTYEETRTITAAEIDAASGSADAMSFTITGPVNTALTIAKTGGDLEVTVEVLDDTGSIGDLRGLFFDVSDDSLLPGLSVTGADVTDSAFSADSVSNLGGGANVNGTTGAPFDGGIEFGTPGIGGDDIRSTTFVLSHASEDLDLDLLAEQGFAVRLTSVGSEGSARSGSEKIEGAAPEVPAGDDTPSFVNVATVDSDETDPVSDDETVTVEEAPSLSFDKIVTDVDGRGADAKVNAAGQVIAYDLVVTNDGNVTLTNVTIVDPLTGTDETVGDLAAGQSATVSATYEVTQADLDDNGGGDGDIDNEATADSEETGPQKDAEEVLIEQSAALAIVKTADVTSVNEAGTVVTYTYTVTNSGNVALSNVTVEDDAATPDDASDDFLATFTGGDTDSDGKLDVEETWTFEAEVTIGQDAIDAGSDIVNVATADADESSPATDDETVTVEQAPSLAFDKQVTDVDDRGADAKVTAAGQVISYLLVAENTGNVTLTDVLIEDPLANVSETVAELAPGATVEIPATYAATQDDLDTNGGGDGDIDNEATAASDQTDEAKDAEEVLLKAAPAIAIVKTANVASVDKAGQTVTYTYTVTNEGNVALSNVTVSDDAFTPGEASDDFAPTFTGGDTDGDGLLDVGEIWVYEADETITQNQIDAGADLTNVATVNADETGPETDHETVAVEQKPVLDIVKDVTAVNGQSADLAVRNPGDVVTWTITVENTGNETLDDVLVEDPTLELSEIIDELAPGESKSFTVEYVATQEDIDGNGGGDGAIENVATATDDRAGKDEDDAEVPVVQDPALKVEKTATAVNGQSADLTVRSAGDEITYDIVVTNSGNLPLDDVAVKDVTVGFSTVIPELEPGESRTFEVTYVATQGDIDTDGDGDGDVDNVAVATDDVAGEAKDDAEVPVDRAPELAFDKQVTDVDGRGPDAKVTAAGQVISYQLVAENKGNTTLTKLTIEDPLTGTEKKLAELEPGDKAVVHATYTTTQQDIDTNGGGDGDIDNEAKADSAETGPQKDAEEVLIDGRAEIAIVKTADVDLVKKAGETITYTYAVTNKGNVTLSNVKVTDDNATPVDASDDFVLGVSNLVSGDLDGDGALDLDETWIFEAEVPVTGEQLEAGGDLTNVAVVTSAEGAKDKDSATVSVEAAERCTDIEDDFDRPDGPAGATIVYAPNAPHQNGSNADDFVWGDNRGNTISTNGGENIVVARGGHDIVNGGNEADEIYGDRGRDILNGNGGDDLLSGGGGHDKLYGAHGDDRIMAGRGKDLVEGGGGDDRIHMGAGNDTVQGEGGDDCIAGGTDNGRIKGSVERGITVKLGDEIFGNGGADTFEYEAGDGVDFLFDFKKGDGDKVKLFGLDEGAATAVTANTPYGPAAGLVFDTDGDGKSDGGVFFQQVRHTSEVRDLIEDGHIEFV